MFPNLQHILCFSEHHLKQFELNHFNIENYELSASYCRKSLGKGGVCIFVHKNLNYSNIKLSKYCNEQDTEACALKLDYNFFNICVILTIRAPSDNLNLFLNGLDKILKSLYEVDLNFIICGDINYLTDSDEKRQLDALLLSYNLSSIVNFPTRTQDQSSIAIGNT
jgi:Endonuclease/Exonuclease/phosphatase family.